jgi:predicted secreted protein
MRPRNAALSSLIMAAVAWTCTAQAQPSAMGAATAATNVLSLSASASVEVTMDTLSVTLAATREGADASAVQSQLRQALEVALTEARRAARPQALEVQTGAFSLSPRYAAPTARSTQPSITGWVGRAELMIEGRDLPAVAQLVARLSTVSVARVSFGLSREAREQVEQETTRQAITRFRTQAEGYARQFGFSGYEIREVQVGLQEPPVMLARAPMMRAAAAPAAEEALPVEAGKTTVSSTVSGSVRMVR